ncbi:MAG: sodium:proton antiporter NhaD [Candidatus Sericytochromatia bacterium]|nr:sodium:proton antiporter NhaD [Candidatus Sericytochromatia bacterium]
MCSPDRDARPFSPPLCRQALASLGSLACLGVAPAHAASGGAQLPPDLTGQGVGLAALATFFVAYALVMAEDVLHLRKSKPMLLAAGLIWVLVALGLSQAGAPQAAEAAVRHNLLEFGELFLFLLAAMTYVNTIEERGVFNALRVRLVRAELSYRALFWATGAFAFCLSPIADNLTTALVAGAVVVTVGVGQPAFVSLACINIVVAANAGGAFSPFGDITTLMVWQKGVVQFGEFFALVVPALVNWLVPAGLMAMAIGRGAPEPQDETVTVLPGAWIIVGLFIATVALAVVFHAWLHLPPVVGMMTGLGLLKLYAYVLQCRTPHAAPVLDEPDDVFAAPPLEPAPQPGPFDPFKQMERAEWDTLMFFYGVIMAVGGLGTLGYLALVSSALYGGLGATWANVLIGLLSAVVDNIPVMFAVLSMNPEMSHGQWLLVTLTAGVGGSLLSIGSAAGVALMGQARGHYTFLSHLRWVWAIVLGYVASIGVHLLLNRHLF